MHDIRDRKPKCGGTLFNAAGMTSLFAFYMESGSPVYQFPNLEKRTDWWALEKMAESGDMKRVGEISGSQLKLDNEDAATEAEPAPAPVKAIATDKLVKKIIKEVTARKGKGYKQFAELDHADGVIKIYVSGQRVKAAGFASRGKTPTPITDPNFLQVEKFSGEGELPHAITTLIKNIGGDMERAAK